MQAVRAKAAAAPVRRPRCGPATTGSNNRFYVLTYPERGTVGVYVGYARFREFVPSTQPGDFYAFPDWPEAAEYYLSVFPAETLVPSFV